jgi:hypothetical protein
MLISCTNAREWMEWKYDFSFICRQMKFVHILYNICITILSLVIHVKLPCKCRGWMQYCMDFHSSINEWNMFMSNATNLQLMHYRIVLFCNYWILPIVLCYNLNSISVLLKGSNLSWNYFATNVHLWIVLFCAYYDWQWLFCIIKHAVT